MKKDEKYSSEKMAEKYLKKWGEQKKNIKVIQNQIEEIIKRDKNYETYKGKDEITKEIYEILYDNIYSDMLMEKKEELKSIIEQSNDMDRIIDGLEDYQKKLLSLRYIEKKNWQYISMNVHISLRQCFNVRKNIISTILTKI